VLSGILQPAEDKQGHPVDAAEARLLVGLRARQIPSAGSGDTFESDTRELYISSRGGGGFGSLVGSDLAPRLLQDRRRRSYLHAPSRSNGRGVGRGMRTDAVVPRGEDRAAPKRDGFHPLTSIPSSSPWAKPCWSCGASLPGRCSTFVLYKIARGETGEGSGSASIRGSAIPNPHPL